MRWFKSLLLGALAMAGAMVLFADDPEAKVKRTTPALAALMRVKLASSEKIVEGLVSKNFEMIAKGSEELKHVCDATEWRAHDDQIYAHYRDELRRTAKKMEALADDKNLDGVAYTYMHSLSTCINCHSYCRDVLRIATSENGPRVTMIPVTEEEARDQHLRSTRR